MILYVIYWPILFVLLVPAGIIGFYFITALKLYRQGKNEANEVKINSARKTLLFTLVIAVLLVLVVYKIVTWIGGV